MLIRFLYKVDNARIGTDHEIFRELLEIIPNQVFRRFGFEPPLRIIKTKNSLTVIIFNFNFNWKKAVVALQILSRNIAMFFVTPTNREVISRRHDQIHSQASLNSFKRF